MSELRVNDQFSNALRAALVSEVRKSSPSPSSAHRRVWAGTAILVGAGLLGGVGAASAGLFELLGADKITPLAPAVKTTYTGSSTVELGTPPADATAIQMKLTCLTPGTFEYQDGSGNSCTEDDIADQRGWTEYLVPLAPGQHSVTFTTAAQTRWQLEAQYVSREITPWGSNSDGTSYGVENANGTPDLVAVQATNGTRGYVLRAELEEADGTTAAKSFRSPEDALAWQEARGDKVVSIPVYDQTGKSVVGEYVIAANNGSVGHE